MKQTIALVDDEATVCEIMRKYLEREGYNVLDARSGLQALSLLSAQKADVLVLDVMLPGLDGFGILRRLRSAEPEEALSLNREVPTIMLTSRTEEHDRLTGFELGADDYVIKPFSPLELVYRVRALLKRVQPISEAEEVIHHTGLVIDPTRRKVTREGVTINLTAKEFDILFLLAQHPQQVFSRDQLLNRIWGYEFYGGENTVTVHVRRLREKLEPNPTYPSYIQTVWGIGYKFDPL
ncbi:MAG: response regulator transcription factor [Anaerolineae bacterium]|nr:response regulator transcription factor [Anaerolineae bacterium]